MKQKNIYLIACIVSAFTSSTALAQKTVVRNSAPSQAVQKELEEAERNMFEKMLHFDTAYFNNFVADDYVTINADGILADTARKKMMQMFKTASTKLSDKRIRVYGPVGIITGRAQIVMNSILVAEFLFTEIWLKKNRKWMYTGWQGTMSKDSPVPGPGKM